MIGPAAGAALQVDGSAGIHVRWVLPCELQVDICIEDAFAGAAVCVSLVGAEQLVEATKIGHRTAPFSGIGYVAPAMLASSLRYTSAPLLSVAGANAWRAPVVSRKCSSAPGRSSRYAREVGDFLETLERVAAGGSVIDPALVKELVAARRVQDPLGEITPREHEVLQLMAEGRSNAAIARLLWVTEGTVEKHVRHILGKLRLSETEDDHRRVLAVITFLEAQSSPTS